MSIIAEVIEHYGSYDAAKEREYIQSQQRTPDQVPTDVAHRQDSNRAQVAHILSRGHGWRSIADLAFLTELAPQQVLSAVNSLVYDGLAQRQLPAIRGTAIHRGVTQRYRWVRESSGETV
jgi:hypothetical protein